MSFKNAIQKAIQDSAPQNAIISTYGDALTFEVYWPLSDPLRPNKTSKLLRISLSTEVEADFKGTPDDAYRCLLPYLKEAFANFDPHHDSNKNKRVPEETWVIDNQIFW